MTNNDTQDGATEQRWDYRRVAAYGMLSSMSIALLAGAYLRGYADAYPGSTADFVSAATQSFGAPMIAVVVFAGGMFFAAGFQSVIIYSQWRAGNAF